MKRPRQLPEYSELVPRKIPFLGTALNIPPAREKRTIDREGGNITEVFNVNTFLHQPFASLPFQTQSDSPFGEWVASHDACFIIMYNTCRRLFYCEKHA